MAAANATRTNAIPHIIMAPNGNGKNWAIAKTAHVPITGRTSRMPVTITHKNRDSPKTLSMMEFKISAIERDRRARARFGVCLDDSMNEPASFAKANDI